MLVWLWESNGQGNAAGFWMLHYQLVFFQTVDMKSVTDILDQASSVG